MRYLKVIAAALFVIVVVVFILHNTDLHRTVHLDFGWELFSETLSGGDPAPAPEATGTAADTAAATPAAKPATGLDVPVFILVFGCFFLGLLLASAFSLSEKYRLKRVIRAETGRIKALESEIKTLRNMPLAGSAEGKPMDAPAVKPAPGAAATKKAKPDAPAKTLPKPPEPVTKGGNGLKSPAAPASKPAPLPQPGLKPALDNKADVKPVAKAATTAPVAPPVKKDDTPARATAPVPAKTGTAAAVTAKPAAGSPDKKADAKDKGASNASATPAVVGASAPKPAATATARDDKPAKKGGFFSWMKGGGKKSGSDKKGD